MVIIYNMYEFLNSVRKLQTQFKNSKFIGAQIMIKMRDKENAKEY